MIRLEKVGEWEVVICDYTKGTFVLTYGNDATAVICKRVLFVSNDMNDSKYATKDAVNKFAKMFKRAYDTIIINRDAVDFASISI